MARQPDAKILPHEHLQHDLEVSKRCHRTQITCFPPQSSFLEGIENAGQKPDDGDQNKSKNQESKTLDRAARQETNVRTSPPGLAAVSCARADYAS